MTRGLTVQDFLLAFRRFASRRGLTATIQSDNAKTFQSFSKEIRKIARSPEVWKYLTDNRITWNFIVEKEPWWGGYWERLVRSIKSPIKKVIGGSTASYDEMCTLLTEVEAVINARPLTYVYDDEESVSYPLTVRLNLWPTDHCTESQQSALRDHEQVQFFNQEIKASSTFAKSVYASVEERIPDQFTRASCDGIKCMRR